MRHMRRPFSFLIVFTLITVSNVSASRIHQEDGIFPNHSCEYIRTLNRFASTKPDAAFYNPAGLSFLEEDGLHVMFSAQTLYVKKTHAMDYYAIQVVGSNETPVQTFHTRSPFTANTDTNIHMSNLPDQYYSETTSPVLPDFDVVYKQDNWTAYFDFSVMQAAPGTTFKDGAAVIDWGNLAIKETECAKDYASDPTTVPELRGYYRKAEATRDEMFIGATFGGSYLINNSLSVGGGIRVIKANGQMSIDVTDVLFFKRNPISGEDFMLNGDDWHIDTEYEGLGFGFICSLDYKVSDALNFGVKCEYYTPLELDKTTNRFTAPSVVEKGGNLDVFKDGSPSPGNELEYQHGLGQSELKVTYPPTIAAGISYGVLDNLKIDGSLEISFRDQVDLDGREDDYDLGYKYGMALRWAVKEDLEASCGYLYTNFGIKEDKRNESDMLLPNHAIGGGFGIKLSKNTEISLGASYIFSEDKQTDIDEFTNATDPTWHSLRKDFKEKRYIFSTGITYRFDNLL